MMRPNALLATAALCLLALAAPPAPARAAAPAVGQAAPALSAPLIDGEPFDLGRLRGKVVIVNFWATWCPPCREEMPALDAFYRRYHDRGLELIGVSVDRPRDRKDVVKVMHAFSYPAAVMKEATANGFGMPDALPVTYVIDSAGIVRARLRPDEITVTEKTLEDAVLSLLPDSARNDSSAAAQTAGGDK